MTTEGGGAKIINRGKLLLDQPTPEDLVLGASLPGSPYSQLNMINDPSSVAVDQPFINEGTLEVSHGYRFYITGTPGNALVNRGVLRVRDQSRLTIISPLISPKTICDVGGLCHLGGVRTALITEPGQVSELSGGGRWFVAKEFRGGTVQLTDGAVLEGAATFNNVTFNGDLHNYDWNSRAAELPGIGGVGYGIEVIARTNFTLNGSITFHRTSADSNPGRLLFAPGTQSVDGQGRIEFEGASDLNQIGQLAGPQNYLALFLTFGPGITIHGSNLLIGSDPQGNPEIRPPWVANLGTLAVNQSGDRLRLRTFAFTNAGTIQVGTNNLVTVVGDFTQTAAGRLEFELSGASPGTTYGQMQMPQHQATLAGALNVKVNALFQPSAGDGFELLTFKSQSGRFDSIDAPPPPPGLGWTGEYGPTSFRLGLH